MSATYSTLRLEENDTFTQTVFWKDSSNTAISLSGYTATLTLTRQRAPYTRFLTLTSPTSGIVLQPSAATGRIDITITPAQIEELVAASVKEVNYALVVVSAHGITTRLLSGRMDVVRL